MNILVVDDQVVVREGFRRILEEVYPDLVVEEAATPPQALALLAGRYWDLVVLDIALPGRGGLDLLEDIHAERPGLPVLVLSSYPEADYAPRAFRAGASGYLTKSSSRDALVEAVQKVVSGGRYVSPALAEHLAGQLASVGERPPHEALSNRELQILRRIGQGRTVTEIGLELNLSVKTISTYRSRVLEKLGLKTTADLVRYAIRAHLTD